MTAARKSKSMVTFGLILRRVGHTEAYSGPLDSLAENERTPEGSAWLSGEECCRQRQTGMKLGDRPWPGMSKGPHGVSKGKVAKEGSSKS